MGTGWNINWTFRQYYDNWHDNTIQFATIQHSTFIFIVLMILNLIRIQRNIDRYAFRIGNYIKRQIIGNPIFTTMVTLYNGHIKCKYASIPLLILMFQMILLWIRDIKLIQKHIYSANYSTLWVSMLS